MATLAFRGSEMFRYRIVAATIAGRPLSIEDIRADDEEPGVRDFEVNFLRLVDKITNGAEVSRFSACVLLARKALM